MCLMSRDDFIHLEFRIVLVNLFEICFSLLVSLFSLSKNELKELSKEREQENILESLGEHFILHSIQLGYE